MYQIEIVSHYDAFSVPTMSQSHFIDQDANTVRGGEGESILFTETIPSILLDNRQNSNNICLNKYLLLVCVFGYLELTLHIKPNNFLSLNNFWRLMPLNM